MAMAGHMLQLKQPGRLSCGTSGSPAVRPARPRQCSSRAKALSGPIAHVRLGAESLRHGFAPLHGNSSTRRQGFCLGLGGRVVVAAAAGEGDAREAEVVGDQEENSTFPAEFKELLVDRGDPPNLFLFAAGLCVVVLMRDVILQELARWGVNFARIALYIAEGIIIGLGKFTNVAAEPIALLMTVVNWAIMAVSDTYALIVEAPVVTLTSSLFLSLAVLSIGDAVAAHKVSGSRSRMVGIAVAIGVAGVLELIPANAMLLGVVALTAFAHFVQKADPVTVFMPAAVAFVAISEPVLQAATFALFLALSVYANWRAGRQPEQTPPEVQESKASAGTRPPLVFLATTASICISLAARLLYFRTVKWLALRSA